MVNVRGKLVAAVDQGATSTRCLIIDDRATIVGRAQVEHAHRCPRPGGLQQPRRGR